MSAATESLISHPRPLTPPAAVPLSGGRAPRPRSGLVPRPALVEQLVQGADAAVVALIAPPGYGKTSLLRDWSERDERPFVWLTAADLHPSATLHTRPPLDGKPPGGDGGVVVAVDDAHLVHPVILSELVETVRRELPEGSTLAVAGRAEPDLPLGRLRAHHDLIELRPGDLALPAAGVERVLRAGGVHLDDDETVAMIAQRTQGWPAGAYLAALALAGRDDASDRARQFSGSHHLVAEYLQDEVLASTTPDVRDFIVHSSVLDELSGPACDAVLGREGSARMLGRLARANLFLQPADAAHERFRWHPLVADALRSMLRRTAPERLPELHGRASAWRQARGDLDGAIDHAAAGGDAGRVGDLLAERVVGYLGRGQAAQVAAWLGAFSEDQLAADPRLSLVAAHTALAGGDAGQAQRWRLAAETAQGPPADGERQAVRAGLALVEAMSPRASLTEMATAAERAYRLEGEGGQWRPLACLLRGVALHLTGEHQASAALLDEGIQCGQRATPVVAAMCVAQRALLAAEADDDWEAATDLTDRALAELEEHALADDPACALLLAITAAVRARAGRSDEAKRELRRGVNGLAELGDFVPWYGAEARILLAQAALGLADVVRARALLAEASRFARRCPDGAIFRDRLDGVWAQIDTLAETRLSGPSSLTIAELRILRFLPSHRSFKEIAVQLGVSANTVKTQAHAVYRKLGAASRSEAVARASEAGLLGQ